MSLRFMPGFPDTLDPSIRLWEDCIDTPMGHVLFGEYFVCEDKLYVRVVKEGGEPYPKKEFDLNEETLAITVGSWSSGSNTWQSVFPMITTFYKGMIVKRLPQRITYYKESSPIMRDKVSYVSPIHT